MTASSLRISLIKDIQVGQKCFELTENIKQAYYNNSTESIDIDQLIIDWIISIKTALKITGYSIDEKTMSRNILQLLLGGEATNILKSKDGHK